MSTFELRKVCTNCYEVGVPHFGPSPFRRCGSCRLAYYCSEDCQRKHWSADHKEVHQKNDIPVCCRGYYDPDSLQMSRPNLSSEVACCTGCSILVDIPLEYHSVREAILSLVPLALNLEKKAFFSLDYLLKFRLCGLKDNLQNICEKLDDTCNLPSEWRKISNSLSTLEVLHHFPLNSVFRFGNGLFPWWESYIVCFGRVKQAVDLLASLGDSGIFHNGNFPVVVVKLVLPEAVVDKKGNPMLFVKEAKAKTVDEQDGLTCYNCDHQITGKLRPPFDPKDVANFHDKALMYPLQRPVNLIKKKKALKKEQVQVKMLGLLEAVPVFCNFVCDMTVKIQEEAKMMEKPAFHLRPGPDILQINYSDTVSSMLLKILQSGSSTKQDLDGVWYIPSWPEQSILKELNSLPEDLESDDVEYLSNIILQFNKLRYEVGKYVFTFMKRWLDQKLGQAYFCRGKIYHLNKSYLKAINDFVRATALFESSNDLRNTPAYKGFLHTGLINEGLEAKCRLAEIYEKLGNVKTALSEADEFITNIEEFTEMGVAVEDALRKKCKEVFFKLVQMPLVINVASLAKKKRDKSLGYFGCDWKLLKLNKVLDLNRRACFFGETACHSTTLWDNKIYILGGTTLYHKPRNFFWVVDLRTKEMLQLTAPKKVVCRESHSCVAYKGCLYVYGGGHPFVCDMTMEDNKVTWKYCIAQNEWTVLKTKGDSPITTGHGACVLNGKMFIFGGECVDGVEYGSQCKKKACIGCDLSVDTDLTDLFVLDLESLEWSKLTGTGGINPKLLGEHNIPEGRQYPIMWPDQENQRLFVLSGAGKRAKIARQLRGSDIDRTPGVAPYEHSNFHFKDLWQYSVSEDEWTKLNLNGNVPVARSETQAAVVKGGAVIFGGYTIAAKTVVKRSGLQVSQYLQDSFEFCYDKMAFHKIHTEHQPGPRAMLGLVADPKKREKVYLVGGRGTVVGFSAEDIAKAKGKLDPVLPTNARKDTKNIVYGDIWELDLAAGEVPGVNVDDDRDQMFCKACDVSSSNTRLYQCSSCLNPTIRYCSKKCFTTDWPNHKTNCLREKEDNKKKQKEQEEAPKEDLEEVD